MGHRLLVAALVATVPGCGRIGFDLLGADGDGGLVATADSGPDSPITCGQWSSPEPVVSVNTPATESDPSLSPDGLSLYFHRDDDIYVATRTSIIDDFGEAARNDDLSSTGHESRVSFTGDGNTVYFTRDETIWSATSLGDGRFDEPEMVPSLGSGAGPSVSADGTELFMSSSSNELTSRDLLRATRAPGSDFGAPVRVEELSTDDYDAFPSLSRDGLTLYFELQSGAFGGVVAARRPSRDEPFGPAAPVDEVTTDDAEGDPWISFDDTELYFVRIVSGNADIWSSRRTCM